jgi:hypothetical protein
MHTTWWFAASPSGTKEDLGKAVGEPEGLNNGQ